jgi:L-asparaginase
MKELQIFTTGGTIDKVYFDQKSDYEIGDATIGDLLESMNVSFEYYVEELMKIDSLDMTESHRRVIYNKVSESPFEHVLITHGTDSMIETAKTLNAIDNKIIVLTGSLQPMAFAKNDAVFNIGCSVAAIQSLPKGVYIVMSGRVFNPDNVVKNYIDGKFECIN